MSIFSIIGVPEPKWASDFKNNIINPDPIPNPLVKKDQAIIAKGATNSVGSIESFFKAIFTGATTEVGKIFKDISGIATILVVLFLIYVFAGKK